MEESVFFEKIEAYKKISRGLAEGTDGFDIRRGMRKVISGYVEDLFALYIAKKINRKELRYFVDKVTSIKFDNGSKATTFKPDVSIINTQNVLTHYYDLKTNLGWKRNLEDYFKKKNDFIEQVKGKKAWINFGSEIEHIVISTQLKYKMVVIDGGNISDDQMNKNIQLAEGYKNIELYILRVPKKGINTEDFNRLYETALELNIIELPFVPLDQKQT